MKKLEKLNKKMIKLKHKTEKLNQKLRKLYAELSEVDVNNYINKFQIYNNTELMEDASNWVMGSISSIEEAIRYIDHSYMDMSYIEKTSKL